MDKKDATMLEVLQRRGRTSFKALAEECGMPESTVRVRVRRLEREGIILGYKAILSPKKVGRETVASVSINLTSKRYEGAVMEELGKMREVLFLSPIIGTHDIIAFTACRDIEGLNNLVNRISKLQGVQGSPRTNIWVGVKKWAEWSIDIPEEVVK